MAELRLPFRWRNLPDVRKINLMMHSAWSKILLITFFPQELLHKFKRIPFGIKRPHMHHLNTETFRLFLILHPTEIRFFLSAGCRHCPVHTRGPSRSPGRKPRSDLRPVVRARASCPGAFRRCDRPEWQRTSGCGRRAAWSCSNPRIQRKIAIVLIAACAVSMGSKPIFHQILGGLRNP